MTPQFGRWSVERAKHDMTNVARLLAVVAIAIATPAMAAAQANPYEYLIGTESEEQPVIPDWKGEGGGLLADPVWYDLLQRNGAYLVLIEWALPRKPDATHMPFRVTDVLLIPPIENGLRLVFDCSPPRTNVVEKIFAVVRVDSRSRPDLLRDVRKAWKVDLASGTISSNPTKGITCSIPSG